MRDLATNENTTKLNRARCKACGDVIESKSRHDFVTCKCGSISLDGGRDYCRRLWPSGDPKGWFEEVV